MIKGPQHYYTKKQRVAGVGSCSLALILAGIGYTIYPLEDSLQNYLGASTAILVGCLGIFFSIRLWRQLDEDSSDQ